jgi:FeS assembly SUF system protein
MSDRDSQGGSPSQAQVTAAAAAVAPPQPPPPAAAAEAPPAAVPAPAAHSDTIARKLLEGRVIETIRSIYDPEIPVNIYDLGLIYEIHVDETSAVKVKMTLTAPACPVAGTLPGEVETKIESIPEVRTADVELVWDPPWDRSRMSEAAMLTLGMF